MSSEAVVNTPPPTTDKEADSQKDVKPQDTAEGAALDENVQETAAKSAGAGGEKVKVVQVKSAGFEAGNYAEILVDGKAIECLENSKGHMRGLHVVIIDPKTGKTHWAQVFDTYDDAMAFQEFVTKAKVPDGHIVAIACKDDCVRRLDASGRNWLKDLGSKDIWNLQYREAFALIAVAGDPSRINEKRGIWLNKAVEVTQIFAAEQEDEEGPLIGSTSDWEGPEEEKMLNNPKDCDEIFGNKKNPKCYMRI